MASLRGAHRPSRCRASSIRSENAWRVLQAAIRACQLEAPASMLAPPVTFIIEARAERDSEGAEAGRGPARIVTPAAVDLWTRSASGRWRHRPPSSSSSPRDCPPAYPTGLSGDQREGRAPPPERREGVLSTHVVHLDELVGAIMTMRSGATPPALALTKMGGSRCPLLGMRDGWDVPTRIRQRAPQAGREARRNGNNWWQRPRSNRAVLWTALATASAGAPQGIRLP